MAFLVSGCTIKLMDKKDGWPETFHILPTPKETLTALGSFIKKFCTITDQGGRHFIPFENNYWKQAESLYEDGATSPSVMDTFET